MNQTRRVIITGGPGTGKTSILTALARRGYCCHSEVSRATIREQLALKSKLLPWEDLRGFSKLVFQGQLDQYHQAEAGKINFYDRGIPDVLAYLRKDRIHEEQLEKMSREFRYDNPIFLTPPWPEIYGQDAERREDVKTMQKIHHALHDVYSDLGYDVVEVPRIPIAERLHFIFQHLEIGH